MKKIDSGLQVRIQKFLKIGFARGLGLNALSLVFLKLVSKRIPSENLVKYFQCVQPRSAIFFAGPDLAFRVCIR